jgi:hypothetical protein
LKLCFIDTVVGDVVGDAAIVDVGLVAAAIAGQAA